MYFSVATWTDLEVGTPLSSVIASLRIDHFLFTKLNVFQWFLTVCVLDNVSHSLCDIASATSDGLEDLCAAIYL